MLTAKQAHRDADRYNFCHNDVELNLTMRRIKDAKNSGNYSVKINCLEPHVVRKLNHLGYNLQHNVIPDPKGRKPTQIFWIISW